jgi:hypothetical protein
MIVVLNDGLRIMINSISMLVMNEMLNRDSILGKAVPAPTS